MTHNEAITPSSIQALSVGERISEPFIYVLRLSDTKTGKPFFKCVVSRDTPVFQGSAGAYSVTGAMKNVDYYRNGLKKGGK